jgi:hypothetical protein
MQFLVDLWRREPVRIIGFVQTAVILAVAFGLNLTADQQAAILAFVAAILALLGAEVGRSQVTPVARPDDGA